ncbi:hypothetical protein [Peptostreptococcus faecalis]|uniref:hypothetical protein n=1 Tax=Peptostreptococcus faecalis TaxID=2045015 RepID=UPI000C7C5000|nr:hypothetical protein [Peptostreptococcus faecalis]
MKETYEEYLTRYIDSYFMRKYWADEEQTPTRYIVSYTKPIDVFYEDGRVVSIPLCDIWKHYGFNSQYSISRQYPEFIDKWSDINPLKPDQIFFKANMVIALNDDKDEESNIAYNPMLLELNPFNSDEKKAYNFRTLQFVQEELKHDTIPTFNEITAVYNHFIRYFKGDSFDVESNHENIFLNLSNSDFLKYFTDLKVSSVGFAATKVRSYNRLFLLLGVDFNVKTEYFVNFIEPRKYASRDEIVAYCEELEDPQQAFLMYATFLGFGELQYKPLTLLKMSDIDEVNMVANVTDGEHNFQIEIDEYFIELAKKCNETRGKTVFRDDPIRMNPVEVFMDYNMESEYIIKARRLRNNNDGFDPISFEKARFMLREANEILFGVDNAVTRTDLKRSGILYRMYVIEQDTGIPWDSKSLKEDNPRLPLKFNVTDMMKWYEKIYKK